MGVSLFIRKLLSSFTIGKLSYVGKHYSGLLCHSLSMTNEKLRIFEEVSTLRFMFVARVLIVTITINPLS